MGSCGRHAVRWESVCLCQARCFDLIPPHKIINHAVVCCSSACRSGLGRQSGCLLRLVQRSEHIFSSSTHRALTPRVRRGPDVARTGLRSSISRDLEKKVSHCSSPFFFFFFVFFLPQTDFYTRLNLVKKSLKRLYTQTTVVSNVCFSNTAMRRVNHVAECGSAPQSVSGWKHLIVHLG